MGDWADQQYPILLTEPWNPATDENCRICWLWTISRILLLCPFILVMAFPLSAFSSLRTCEYQFHLSLSCKVGTGKLSLCKSLICRWYFFLQTPMKRKRFLIFFCDWFLLILLCRKCIHDSHQNRSVVLGVMDDKGHIRKTLGKATR